MFLNLKLYEVEPSSVREVLSKIEKVFNFKKEIDVLIEFKEFNLQAYLSSSNCAFYLKDKKDIYVTKDRYKFLFLSEDEEPTKLTEIVGYSGFLIKNPISLDEFINNIYYIYKLTENMVFQ